MGDTSLYVDTSHFKKRSRSFSPDDDGERPNRRNRSQLPYTRVRMRPGLYFHLLIKLAPAHV